MADPEKARLTAEIPKELMKRLRIRAVETEKEIREIVIEALEAALAKPKKGAARG